MDDQCPTGLSNFVACSPFAGRKHKEESAITWGITKALNSTWEVGQCEHRYPQSRRRCDRVIKLRDGSRLWLEIKLSWRTWFYEVVKHNNQFVYHGYFSGEHHP